MIQPHTAYDYLTQSRQRVHDAVRPLSVEQYAREFPIGMKTLGATLTHMMISEWYYVERILHREVPPYDQWPVRSENPLPFAALEDGWNKQAKRTRTAMGEVRDWDGPLEYRVTNDEGVPLVVTASVAGLFTQLVLHEVHHRAQVLNMLRHCNVTLDDLDFNALMFQRRKA